MATGFTERQGRFRSKLLVALGLAGAWSCRPAPVAERWVAADHLTRNRDDGLVYDGLHPYTGAACALDPRTADTQAVMHFRQGAADGRWRQFYASGRLYEDRLYANGQKTGLLQQWWENGRPQLRVCFQNGEYEGRYCEWNPAGRLVKKMHYHQGHEEGRQECWYDNGTVKANYLIRDSRRYGLLGTKNCVNVLDSLLLR